MKNRYSNGWVSKKLFIYIGFLSFFLITGFLISSYIIFKSFHYSEIINVSGRVRGEIQRFSKLYFAGDREKLKTVAVEIDHCLHHLEKRVDELKLPLWDIGNDFTPLEVINCWRKLSEAIFKNGWDRKKVLDFSENCWYLADNRTTFYQKIAERNLIFLNYIYYFIFISTILIIALLIRLNVTEIFRKLEKRANFDGLTETLNRGAFLEIYPAIAKDKFFYPLSLIIFDLDDFKGINDNFGHNTGDKVLRNVAMEAKKHLRRSDIIVRWGGEEFLVILPHTDLEGAKTVAEKLRQSLENLAIPEVKGRKITASFGITEILPGEKLEKAIARADEALYLAKRTGKNKVVEKPPERGT
jgi:diguanylate cyclase (GGDEF)-like protein